MAKQSDPCTSPAPADSEATHIAEFEAEFARLNSPEEQERRQREEYAQRQREHEELKAKGRPLDELVVSEFFLVNDVVSQSYPTSFSQSSTMVRGGRSPIYSGGYRTELVLAVTPAVKGISVRTLRFDGLSVVRAGETITAKIARYEEKEFCDDEIRRPCSPVWTYYFDRPYLAEESAIEIAVLRMDGAPVRRDRSVDYGRFVKK